LVLVASTRIVGWTLFWCVQVTLSLQKYQHLTEFVYPRLWDYTAINCEIGLVLHVYCRPTLPQFCPINLQQVHESQELICSTLLGYYLSNFGAVSDTNTAELLCQCYFNKSNHVYLHSGVAFIAWTFLYEINAITSEESKVATTATPQQHD